MGHRWPEFDTCLPPFSLKTHREAADKGPGVERVEGLVHEVLGEGFVRGRWGAMLNMVDVEQDEAARDRFDALQYSFFSREEEGNLDGGLEVCIAFSKRRFPTVIRGGC